MNDNKTLTEIEQINIDALGWKFIHRDKEEKVCAVAFGLDERDMIRMSLEILKWNCEPEQIKELFKLTEKERADIILSVKIKRKEFELSELQKQLISNELI